MPTVLNSADRSPEAGAPTALPMILHARRWMAQFGCCATVSVLMGLLSGSASAQNGTSVPEVLTKAGLVHTRPANAPIAQVQLRGTVTYYDPSDGVMFFQDASGGVYVNTNKPYDVRTGDEVVIKGVTNPSYRTEVALNPEIQVVGRGKRYPAPEFSHSKLATGDGDCLLVSFRGVVRAQDLEQHQASFLPQPVPSIHLDVAMDGGAVEVYLDSSFGNNPPSLVDATVEIQGVAGGAFDQKNQLTGIILYIPSSEYIHVLKRPTSKLGDLPLTDIDDVFRSQQIQDTSSRLRVRGTVTYYKKGDSAVLEDHGKSIFVQTRQTSALEIGDVVDAFGFASDREYAPSLSKASLVKTGSSMRLKPQPVTYEQAFSGLYSDNLVSISGRLVSQLQSQGTETLVLDDDGHLVNATLESPKALEPYPAGSRVQVTGICRIMPGGPFRVPVMFRIAMRDAGDVQLLAEPSWWTVRHLLGLLAVFLAAATLIAGWALILRQRLLVQTNRIQRSMLIARQRSRILEKINSNPTPDALLTLICDTVTSLMQGVKCDYVFEENGSQRTTTAVLEDAVPSQQLSRIDLLGNEGELLGWITVTELDSYVPLPDRHEVLDMLAETSRLAINQLILHRALVHRSTHDSLTDLPNRRLCDVRFEAALEDARVNGSQVAVIYIDVDHFKEVNDQHGHRIGDLYLKQISARLLAAKRQNDTLARIGGDEFLLIMPSTSSYEDAESLVPRLEKCFDHPFSIEGRLILGSASLGFARYPDHGATAEELKLHADHDMYAIKRRKSQPVTMVPSRIA